MTIPKLFLCLYDNMNWRVIISRIIWNNKLNRMKQFLNGVWNVKTTPDLFRANTPFKRDIKHGCTCKFIKYLQLLLETFLNVYLQCSTLKQSLTLQLLSWVYIWGPLLTTVIQSLLSFGKSLYDLQSVCNIIHKWRLKYLFAFKNTNLLLLLDKQQK